MTFSKRLMIPNHSNPAANPADQVRSAQATSHDFCFVCGQSNPVGLGIRYEALSDGSVRGEFHAHAALEGYPGRLHGGVTAALLDGAMTHCLFAQGCQAVTAELRVRFRSRIESGPSIIVRAWEERSRPPLHHVCAELSQGGRVCATATGRFMEKESA